MRRSRRWYADTGFASRVLKACILGPVHAMSSGQALKRGARLELESLDVVAVLRVERDRVAELERPDRRAPRDAGAGRVTERLELRLGPVRIDLARVEEQARAHRLLALQDRVERLEVADDLALAAERVAELVLRTERRRVVAAHRIDAAREERLEERQRLAGEAVAIAKVGTRHQHQIAPDRPVDRVRVLDLVVGEVAERQPGLDQQTLQSAARRIEHVVARVARPPGGQDVRVRRRSEFVDEKLVRERAVVEQRDPRVLVARAEIDRVDLGDRYAEADRRAERVGRILRDVEAG